LWRSESRNERSLSAADRRRLRDGRRTDRYRQKSEALPPSNTRSGPATTTNTQSRSVPGTVATAARKNFICIANAPASLPFSFRFTPEVEGCAAPWYSVRPDQFNREASP